MGRDAAGDEVVVRVGTDLQHFRGYLGILSEESIPVATLHAEDSPRLSGLDAHKLLL